MSGSKEKSDKSPLRGCREGGRCTVPRWVDVACSNRLACAPLSPRVSPGDPSTTVRRTPAAAPLEARTVSRDAVVSPPGSVPTGPPSGVRRAAACAPQAPEGCRCGGPPSTAGSVRGSTAEVSTRDSSMRPALEAPKELPPRSSVLQRVCDWSADDGVPDCGRGCAGGARRADAAKRCPFSGRRRPGWVPRRRCAGPRFAAAPERQKNRRREAVNLHRRGVRVVR
jgi:hypothetical protein